MPTATKRRLVPKVGKVYNAFVDGKISYSRMIKVKITRKLNLKKDKVSKRLLKLINYEIKSCWWLYDEKQTIIYRGKVLNDDDSYNDLYGYQWFLRTTRGGLFGIGAGLGDAELDVDGSLLRELEEIFKDEI